MFIHDLVGSEQHPVYQAVAAENLGRQYSFLRSIVLASLQLGQPVLSIEIIKALNYHAISCLHTNAGEFRPCQVWVGDYEPPQHFRVPALMQMFTNEVNRWWSDVDPVSLAAFVLWKLNHIHPFINGNGRTARVTAYYVLCAKLGGWLPGEKLLPELIKENRQEYVQALKHADASILQGEHVDLAPLHDLLSRLLNQQIEAANVDTATTDPKEIILPEAPPSNGVGAIHDQPGL